MTQRTRTIRRTWLRVGVSLLGSGLLLFGILVLIRAGITKPALAQGPSCVQVSTDITADTTWDQPCYIVQTDTVAIRNGAMLTIQAGVVISVQKGAQIQIVDGGHLHAVGTGTDPIIFTSNVTPSEQARGDWLGILIDETALANTIEYATIEYATTGINMGVQLHVTNTIRHNTFYSNGDEAMGGAIFGSPDSNDISYNTVSNCSTGFKFNKAFGNRILSNTFHNIDSHAIWFAKGLAVGGDNNILMNNTIYDCGGDGIHWEIGDSNHIERNTIYNCQGNGIHLDTGFGNIVLTNTVHHNVEAGILAKQLTLPTFEGNELYGNASLPTSTALGAMVITNNTTARILNNNLHDNGHDGGTYKAALYLDGNSTFLVNNVVATGNIILGDVGEGIHYAAANSGAPLIEENVICVTCFGGSYDLENLDSPITAAGNWWGTNTPTSGVEIVGPVTFAPWINLTVTVADSGLPADGTSTTVITITMNDGAGHTVPPPARTITLTASVGQVTPSIVTLDDRGIATAVYTAGSAPTTAIITATELCGFHVVATIDLEATNVAITKTTSVAQTLPGSVLNYTISYSNTSDVLARHVWITDTLPAGTSYVTDDSGLPVHTSPTQVWWQIGDLPAHMGGDFVLTLSVDSGSCDTWLVNTAVITTTTAEVTTADNTTTTPIIQVVCADMVITKTVVPNQATPGSVVTYTLDYANQGQADAANVSISDRLDTGLSFGGIVSGPNPVSTATRPITWNLGTLTGPASGSIAFTATVEGDVACDTWLTNVVTVTTTTPEGTAGNNATSTSLHVACADVAITKTVAPFQTIPGGVVTYTLDYANQGQADAANVSISDSLDTGLSFGGVVSGPNPVSTATRPITWNLGTLTGLASGSIAFTATVEGDVACGTRLTNVATITTTTTEAAVDNNVSSVVLTVTCAPNLVVAKEDQVGPIDGGISGLLTLLDENEVAAQVADSFVTQWRDWVYEGDVVTYTIAIVNTSPYTATGVYVTETLPANTSFVGGTCLSPPSCVGNTWSRIDSSDVYSMAVGDLASTGGAVVEFIVRITDTLPAGVTEVVNHACARSDQQELDPADNCSSQQTPVHRRVMRVSKRTNVPCAFPGDVVVYTINYTNTGTVAESGVVLTEFLPDHTTYVGGSCDWREIDSSSVYTCPLGTVAANTTGSETFAVQIDDPLSDAVTAITNVVHISGGNEFTLITPLPWQPDLAVVKNDNVSMIPAAFVELYETLRGHMYAQQVGTLQAGYVHPGDVISYSIAYLNTGRTPATGVVLTETLPLHTSYVGYGWAPAGGRLYSLSIGPLDPGEGGIVEFYVRVDDLVPTSVEWITNVVEIGGNELECNTVNNISTEETPITGTVTAAYTLFLPLVLRNYPPDTNGGIETIPVGAHPKVLVISEDHNRVYVTLADDDGNGNPGGSGRLVTLDLTARRVVDKVPTGGIQPVGIAMLDNRLYVANNGSDEVAVMDATTLSVLRTIPVGHLPFGVAAAEDRVYVTNFDDGTLSIIDAATDTVVNTVTVGRHPAFPAALGNCVYVANHSGREGVTVVCCDGAEIYRLREEWGYFATAIDPTHNLVFFSRRDGLPGLYEASLSPPYDADKPVRKKDMLSTPPFAIAYNPTTNHILVVAAANNQLHIIWPGGYQTGTVWPLLPQNEGPEWHGGQGLDVTGHDVWVANYADGSVSVLYDPP